MVGTFAHHDALRRTTAGPKRSAWHSVYAMVICRLCCGNEQNAHARGVGSCHGREGAVSWRPAAISREASAGLSVGG